LFPKLVFVVAVGREKRTFALMLHFVALLFSQKNCLETQDFRFCHISKQCIRRIVKWLLLGVVLKRVIRSI